MPHCSPPGWKQPQLDHQQTLSIVIKQLPLGPKRTLSAMLCSSVLKKRPSAETFLSYCTCNKMENALRSTEVFVYLLRGVSIDFSPRCQEQQHNKGSSRAVLCECIKHTIYTSQTDLNNQWCWHTVHTIQFMRYIFRWTDTKLHIIIIYCIKFKDTAMKTTHLSSRSWYPSIFEWVVSSLLGLIGPDASFITSFWLAYHCCLWHPCKNFR